MKPYIIKGLCALFLSSFLTFAFAKEVIIMDEDFHDDEGVFHFGATFNYLIQSNDLPQVQVDNNLIPDATVLPDYPLGHDDPETMPGWGGEFGYLFPNHKNEVLIRYQQIKTDQSEELTFIGFAQEGNFSFVDANSHQSYDFDYYDGEVLGLHYFNIEESFVWNLGLGIKYTKISQQSTGTYDIADPSSPTPLFTIPSTVYNNFHGLGPLFASGFSWELDDTYFIVGDFGISALIGTAEANIDSITYSTIQPTTQFAEFRQKDSKVILGLEGDLGFIWQLALNDDINTNIELGFEVSYYPNALIEIHEVGIQSYTILNPFIDIFADNDYFNYGPYVTLSADF
jgi:hypothetical protein